MPKLHVSQEEAGDRIDHYLSSALPDLSRNQIQKLIKDHEVRVDRIPVKKSYLVQTGDVIELVIPDEDPFELVSQNLPLEIVYQDQDIAVVNKPRGMVVHPAPGHRRDTLVNALLFHLDDLANPESDRPGIVHRMDKDTTGLLIVTKNQATHRYFLDLFKRHDIERTYWALVHGRISFSEKTIDAPLGRSLKNRKMFTIDQSGRRAVTHLELLKAWADYSLLSCQLETGRTHQIRVHLKSINHPIVGDPVYGPRKGEFRSQGQFLHAKRLSFIHPDGRQMSFETDLPDDFKKILKRLDQTNTRL